MLLQIRRPRRPEPLPLRERKEADGPAGDTGVWINVRHKRDRAAPAGQRTSRKTSLAARGPASAPQK
ncbi:MAG TPA: hypothetical protein VKE26_03730 [Xanthobacteraceae bacterium]|jgi:hypothetical protein|nr:hypothetical protein [Xanthobacteraceae bacterium]